MRIRAAHFGFQRILLGIGMGMLLFGCGRALRITDRPIPFNAERYRLSLEYLRERYGIETDTPRIQPRMLVLHYTVLPTLESTFRAFNPAVLPGSREDIQQAGNLNVSAHFVVDRDGTIYRLMPETIMARHVIGLNHSAIGIENVGGGPELPLTRRQLRANIRLVKYLTKKYGLEYLIGHYEYILFEGHDLWLEKEEGYRTEKTDPGKEFMRDVRRAVKRFNFKPVPEKDDPDELHPFYHHCCAFLQSGLRRTDPRFNSFPI